MKFELLVKRLTGLLNPKEEAEFKTWYTEFPDHEEYWREQEKQFAVIRSEKNAWKQLEGKIGLESKEQMTPLRKKKSYKLYMAAASIALLVAFGAWFYKELLPGVSSGDDIEIGSSKAILTLEDGTEVPLKPGEEYIYGNIRSNGAQIAYDAKSTPGEKINYNQLTVPRGGEYFLLLADSTKVWLNSESKIKYPEKFREGKTRSVELVYGEAFFEVSPAAKHGGSTFRVNTRNQEIEVLGTQFNISAYREDHAVTSTLVEGKVVLKSGEVKKALKPGDQAVVRKENQGILIKKVDTYNYTAWKEGYFGYDNQPLYEIMQMLSRWYDVEVIFENENLKNIRYNGVLSRREPIQGLLQMFSGDIDYEIQGKQVRIKSK